MSRLGISRFPQVRPFLMASADRDALVVVFRATGEYKWKRKRKWATDAELSAWHGVVVDEDGRVVKLHLVADLLQGIPRPTLRMQVARVLCVQYYCSRFGQ